MTTTRYMAFWPLPGRWEDYVQNLVRILEKIKESKLTIDELASWASNQFGSKLEWTKNAIMIIIVHTSVVSSMENGALRLSEAGQKFLNTKDNEVILDRFLQSIWGMKEILIWLKERPLTLEEVFVNCKSFGAPWKRNYQVGFRLRWLRALGVIDRRLGKYYLTERGKEFTKKLGLEAPMPISQAPPIVKPIAKSKDIVGEPIYFGEFVYAPLNEAGVILLFSKIMGELGIYYEASPSTFPDMIARRKTKEGLERIFVEFEYKSSHFLQHKHDAKNCDVIVCWEHDWKDCPLEVIELKEVVKRLKA